MECLICNSTKNSSYRCEYKLEIHEDAKYFGDLKIDKCEEYDFSSYSFDEDHRFQSESLKSYYRIKSRLTYDSFKQFMKRFIPNKILRLRQIILNSKNIDEMYKLGLFTSNSGDNCYLRGILKKRI